MWQVSKRAVISTRFFAIILVVVAIAFVGTIVFQNSTKESDQNSAPLSQDIHIIGNLSAPVKVTVYTDFECPHCKKFHESHMLSLQQKFGDKVVFIYKNFPRTEHPEAFEKAQAAECVFKIAGDVAYWKYVSQLFKTEPPEFTNDKADAPYRAVRDIGLDAEKIHACVTSGDTTGIIESDLAEVNKIGAYATPAIYVTGNGKTFLIQGDRGSETNIAIQQALIL